MVTTPTSWIKSEEEGRYRGLAMSQMRILQQQLALGQLNSGSRVVRLDNGVVIECNVCFNRQDVLIHVPAYVHTDKPVDDTTYSYAPPDFRLYPKEVVAPLSVAQRDWVLYSGQAAYVMTSLHTLLVNAAPNFAPPHSFVAVSAGAQMVIDGMSVAIPAGPYPCEDTDQACWSWTNGTDAVIGSEYDWLGAPAWFKVGGKFERCTCGDSLGYELRACSIVTALYLGELAPHLRCWFYMDSTTSPVMVVKQIPLDLLTHDPPDYNQIAAQTVTVATCSVSGAIASIGGAASISLSRRVSLSSSGHKLCALTQGRYSSALSYGHVLEFNLDDGGSLSVSVAKSPVIAEMYSGDTTVYYLDCCYVGDELLTARYEIVTRHTVETYNTFDNAPGYPMPGGVGSSLIHQVATADMVFGDIRIPCYYAMHYAHYQAVADSSSYVYTITTRHMSHQSIIKSYDLKGGTVVVYEQTMADGSETPPADQYKEVVTRQSWDKVDGAWVAAGSTTLGDIDALVSVSTFVQYLPHDIHGEHRTVAYLRTYEVTRDNEFKPVFPDDGSVLPNAIDAADYGPFASMFIVQNYFGSGDADVTRYWVPIYSYGLDTPVIKTAYDGRKLVYFLSDISVGSNGMPNGMYLRNDFTEQTATTEFYGSPSDLHASDLYAQLGFSAVAGSGITVSTVLESNPLVPDGLIAKVFPAYYGVRVTSVKFGSVEAFPSLLVNGLMSRVGGSWLKFADSTWFYEEILGVTLAAGVEVSVTYECLSSGEMLL